MGEIVTGQHGNRRQAFAIWAATAITVATWACISITHAADPAFVGVLAFAVEDEGAQVLGLTPEVRQKLADLIARREQEALNLVMEIKDLSATERQARLSRFAADSEQLARGLLTRPWGTETTRLSADALIDHRFDEARDRPVVEHVAAVAEERGLPMAQVALAWVMSNPVVAAPIAGATKPEHIDDAVAAVDVELSHEETTLLESAYTPRDNMF